MSLYLIKIPFFLEIKLNYCQTFIGVELDTQLVPIPDFVKSIPGRVSDATHELVFLAVQLPPLGLKSYYITKSLDTSSQKQSESIGLQFQGKKNEDITISNDVKNYDFKRY